MRDVEKQTLKNLGYELIEIKKSINVYPEISSHVDIFACKVKDKIIVEKSAYKMLKNKLNNDENILISGEKMISYDYPNDIKYNVCIVGNKAIHNFKYTDSKIISELNKNNFELINVKQGYSNCSISVIDDVLSFKSLSYSSCKLRYFLSISDNLLLYPSILLSRLIVLVCIYNCTGCLNVFKNDINPCSTETFSISDIKS